MGCNAVARYAITRAGPEVLFPKLRGARGEAQASTSDFSNASISLLIYYSTYSSLDYAEDTLVYTPWVVRQRDARSGSKSL